MLKRYNITHASAEDVVEGANYNKGAAAVYLKAASRLKVKLSTELLTRNAGKNGMKHEPSCISGKNWTLHEPCFIPVWRNVQACHLIHLCNKHPPLGELQQAEQLGQDVCKYLWNNLRLFKTVTENLSQSVWIHSPPMQPVMGKMTGKRLSQSCHEVFGGEK